MVCPKRRAKLALVPNAPGTGSIIFQVSLSLCFFIFKFPNKKEENRVPKKVKEVEGNWSNWMKKEKDGRRRKDEKCLTEIKSVRHFPQIPSHFSMILRSCNPIGELPTSLNHMSSLKTLDLSYNNFTSTGGVDDCQKSGLNLFASDSRINNSGAVSCLGNLNCPAEPSHYLYINCGGNVETIDNITYEADGYDNKTFHRSTYWAFSGTGFFLDDSITKGSLVRENKQVASSVGPLYINARLSYSSLTYYAFCLRNATFNVSLHFAEIDFTDDKNYSSLGRRIFDVYIQVFQHISS
ncbi:hypothetical protein PVK06_000478 [Gossypium arboreum]|uniref:Malectin domain-containing protein n=1 Tax=Gossypium arboreum TaxID=29729 RepID=A0ABR0QZR9_GOSAR|nr:hypothetical protein PVK06_000478 [Gossypium arboreum]